MCLLCIGPQKPNSQGVGLLGSESFSVNMGSSDISMRAERWQMLVKEHGLSLMLRDNGWRVPRRVVLFSHPDEIFASCSWLFHSQPTLHEGFKESLPQVHDKAAELLHATVGQLVSHLTLVMCSGTVATQQYHNAVGGQSLAALHQDGQRAIA